MLTESTDVIGVASEQDGEVLGGASTQGLAGNGTQSRCPEDSAVPSGYRDAVIVPFRATRSAASRNFMMEGKASMQVEFRGFQARAKISGKANWACKNVPVCSGALQQFSSR